MRFGWFCSPFRTLCVKMSCFWVAFIVLSWSTRWFVWRLRYLCCEYWRKGDLVWVWGQCRECSTGVFLGTWDGCFFWGVSLCQNLWFCLFLWTVWYTGTSWTFLFWAWAVAFRTIFWWCSKWSWCWSISISSGSWLVNSRVAWMVGYYWECDHLLLCVWLLCVWLLFGGIVVIIEVANWVGDVIIFVEMMTTKHWSLNHDYQQSNSDQHSSPTSSPPSLFASLLHLPPLTDLLSSILHTLCLHRFTQSSFWLFYSLILCFMLPPHYCCLFRGLALNITN